MSDLEAMRQEAFTWFKVAIWKINSSQTPKYEFDDSPVWVKYFIDEYSDPNNDLLYIEWIDIVDAFGYDFDAGLRDIANCLWDIIAEIYNEDSAEKWLTPIYDYADAYEQE